MMSNRGCSRLPEQVEFQDLQWRSSTKPRTQRRAFMKNLLTFAAALMAAFAVNLQGAVITVTRTSDSGAGSLRTAVKNARSGDTINFSLAYPAVITLASGELVLSKDISIA